MNSDESYDPDSPEPSVPSFLAKDIAGRCGLACVAISLIGLDAWILWITHRFVGWQGWFDRIVGLLLHELILTVGVFGLLLLVWAAFTPAWIRNILAAVHRKISFIATCFAVAFISVFVCLLVFAVLQLSGLLE